MQPKKLTDDDIQNAVRSAIKQAVDFCESEVAEDRIRNIKYYNGEMTLEAEEGRSKVVATKCRDHVRMVKPVLMRTFMQSGKPVEFVPVSPDDIQAAEQATEYVNWKFNENNGFQVLNDVIDDALIKKTGIAKVHWDETESVEFDDLRNLMPEALAFVQAEPGIEVLEEEPNEDGTVDVKISKTTTTGKLKVEAIAPEDFFVDSGATSIDDFYVCGDSQEMVVGDLVEQGYDFEEIYNLGGSNDETIGEEEDYQRNKYDDDDQDHKNDPSMRPVLVTEAYMRMDIEGTGVPRLYQFTCAGNNHKVLDYTLADDVPYAVFEVDPIPHTFFGTALVDLLWQDQDTATSLRRGIIDNVHITNNPRLVVNENSGNIEDALNPEIGAILREEGAPGTGYIPFSIPSNVQTTLPAIQYFDMTMEDKTGVSKSSLGMDANALQSTTAAGVNAAVQAGSANAELMARHLAEGGMRQLFRKMMKLTRQNAPANEMMRLNGAFVPVDPQSWNANMDLQSRVGLGNGQKEQRMMALDRVLMDQAQIMSAYGPGNPFVTFGQMYNTRADMLELSGVHSVTRYYNAMTPEQEQQFLMAMQQQQQGQQQGTDPNAAFVQVEGMKVQQKAQADASKLQVDVLKAKAKDDLDRDKMAQDAHFKAAQMEIDTGLRVNNDRLKAEQAMPRPFPS